MSKYIIPLSFGFLLGWFLLFLISQTSMPDLEFGSIPIDFFSDNYERLPFHTQNLVRQASLLRTAQVFLKYGLLWGTIPCATMCVLYKFLKSRSRAMFIVAGYAWGFVISCAAVFLFGFLGGLGTLHSDHLLDAFIYASFGGMISLICLRVFVLAGTGIGGAVAAVFQRSCQEIGKPLISILCEQAKCKH